MEYDDVVVVESPAYEVRVEVARLRREHNQLIGELSVFSERADTKNLVLEDGMLASGDFNFSAPRSLADKAKYLQTRARSGEKIDWLRVMEATALKVRQHEAHGAPAINLWDVPKRPPDCRNYLVEGLAIPQADSTILFGDGGTAKSYIALNFIGQLAFQVAKVMYIDWEWDKYVHAERLDLLFGHLGRQPPIHYLHCYGALHRELEHVKREIRRLGIQYAVLDSIGLAIDGAPEDAENALRYFQCVNQIGTGTLNIAHIAKAEGADKKPIGSVFWHNLGRNSWNVKGEQTGPSTMQVALHHRKNNRGPLLPSIAYQLDFAPKRTSIRRISVNDTQGLRDGVPIWQQISALLESRGDAIIADIADELGKDVRDIKRAISRKPGLFKIVNSGGNEQDKVHLASGTSRGTTF